MGAVRILRVGQEWFDGDIHNLSVQGDASYHIVNVGASANCRCTYSPILKSADELGFGKDLPPGQRAKWDGEAPETTTFPKWLKGEDAETQKMALGATRYRLWKSKKIPLSGFANPGHIFTLAELKVLYPGAF